jgi:hypothetical protein
MSTSRRGPSSLGQRESPLRSRHRAYKRLPAKASNPPNYDVHGRAPQCPVDVDSSRLLRANSGHSSTAGERVRSTHSGHSAALPWRLLAEQRMSMQRMFAGSRQKLAPCRPKGDITPRRYRGIASRMKLGERVASTRDIASPADSKRTENCLSVRHAPPWTTSMLISTSQFG